MLNISFNKCSEAKWSQESWYLHLLFNRGFAALYQMKTDSPEEEKAKSHCLLGFYQFVDI